MGTIVTFLSSILGLLMDLFFRALTWVGYPRLWACIVLFAATTRLLFLKQKIGTQRNNLLKPVVAWDLLSADPNYFQQTKDKTVLLARNALKKQIHKKYKISNTSGLLSTLIQYPIWVALFYVVKNPQEFVPSLENASLVSSQVNSLFGVPLSVSPLDAMTEHGAILLVPLVLMISNFLKMSRPLKQAKGAKEIIKVVILCLFFTGLIGWFSASLPLAVPLYWATNDVVNACLDAIIKKRLSKNKEIVSLLHAAAESKRRADEAAAVQATKDSETAQEDEATSVEVVADDNAECIKKE